MTSTEGEQGAGRLHTLPQLITDAAILCAERAEASLPALVALAGAAMSDAASAVFEIQNRRLLLAAGAEATELSSAAADCLAFWPAPVPTDECARVFTHPLIAEGSLLGVLAVRVDTDLPTDPARRIALALVPFFVLGLRQRTSRREVLAAQAQVERRIREVATVYEVGQAMDKIEIDRLLDMITERAAQVMDAQACSLLLKLPDADSLIIAASYGLQDEVVENTRIFVGQGIAGQVAATGEPLRLGDLADDPKYENMGSAPGVSSSICMPMKDESGRVQGVLCIRRCSPSPPFTDEDLRLFSIFATQVALAVNNAQLYAKLNHKLQELSTLAALTETISSTLDLDQVLNQVADNLVDVVHFDRCRIYLADIDTGVFTPRIVRGFSWAYSEDRIHEPALGDGVVELVARRQAPILVDDVQTALAPLRAYGLSLGMDSFYAQPIVARGRCIGVLVVSNTGPHRPITPDSIELLSTFVHQAGIAIENARFYASQERRYAELTTLYEVSSTLAATSGVQTAAETVNDLAIKITDSDAGLLLLFETEEEEGLSALQWRGVSSELGQRLRSFGAPVPVRPDARGIQSPRLLLGPEAAGLFGPEWAPVLQQFVAEHRATALVPLIVEEAPVGFLVLGKQGRDFSGGALTLISVASSQAASVLTNARSYERRIGQRELELSAIRELMQKVRAARTFDEALNSILDIVASIVWSDESLLLTVDQSGMTMTARAARGEGSASKIGVEVLSLEGDSLAAQSLRERTALISALSGSEADADDSRSGRPQSQLALPLIVDDALIGVLTMQSRTPDLYSEESVKMLHLVASQAATIYQEMNSLRTLTRYTDNILRSIAAGVITVDKNGGIVTWNRRAEEITRLSPQQIVGRHYSDFIRMLQGESQGRDETMKMLELTALTGRVFTRNQLCYQLPGGDETYVNLSASRLVSESGEYLGVVIVFEDITNEIQMKEEVERVSKLAETGQLAANIAHELRNPLSSIKGAAQLLRNELPADYVQQHGEFLDIIVDEVNGLNRMTSEFLEFSRATPPEMKRVSVNAVIGRLLQFMNTYLVGQDVTLLQALDDDLPEILLDRPQIEQVVKNIVINSAQAMPHGGYLTVSSRYFASSETVEVAFADTGVGIPPEKLEKIWTPFFTTKTKGTGLGLAIARKIVETHGGRLNVRSVPGEGSTFTIHLPVKPPQTGLMPQGRAEITDQRSDQPGGVYEMPPAYATEK